MSTDNMAISVALAKAQKASVGADIITQTLDTVNRYGSKKKKGSCNDMAASYDFQKSVLSAVYEPKGTITEIKS